MSAAPRRPQPAPPADRPGHRFYMRVYHLPGQLARARARVAQLEREARELGLRNLVS